MITTSSLQSMRQDFKQSFQILIVFKKEDAANRPTGFVAIGLAIAIGLVAFGFH
jgi:hypothetical protein